MNKSKIVQKKFNQLRSQAEELIRKKRFIKPAIGTEDPLKLIHELQTYQIELELQNDELNRSQQELMNTQIKYTHLYDFSPVGYVSLSLKGVILNANLTLADMLATERSLMINKLFSAHIIFEDQDIFYRYLKELSAAKEKQFCELRMKKKDGEIIEVQLESSVILDENEEPVGYRTVAMNICDRKQAEEKLRQFKSIVSSSSDMMALIDTNFKYLTVNNAYLNFLDKKRDEVIGHSISEIFGEKFFRETVKPNAESCMDGFNVRYSTWFEFPNIGRRFMDVGYSPYKSDDNQIIGFVVNARDSTNLKLNQILLEQNQLQLEAILNNIKLSIYITDITSHEILFINKHLKHYYSEDIIGKICWEVFCENQDCPCEYCTNQNLIDSDGKPVSPFITEVYNENEKKWCEKNDSAIPWIDGNLVHLGITTDITERKKLEHKQKRLKKILEKKVRERTADLEDMNATLKVLLKKREEDKSEIEDKIFSNHKLVLSPIIDNFKKNLKKQKNLDLINILDSELKNIMSPFSKKLSDQMINLTPTEINVANLIKLGKTNKEISSMLNSSVHTISRHRENIRKKTGLKNKKINLRSFLMALN